MGGNIDGIRPRILGVDMTTDPRRHWETTHPAFSLRHKVIKLIAMKPNLTIQHLKKHLPALMERCKFEYGMDRDETVAWISKHYRTPKFMVALEIRHWQRLSPEMRRRIFV